MGHRRDLNDLKNTSLPVDLREGSGREAQQFERTFGPGWKHIWRVMVQGLRQESLISPQQAVGLVQAAGLHSVDIEAPLTQRERRQKPVHLTRFPQLASERLAFFFQSLKWIDKDRGGRGSFEPATDSLTGMRFHPGSVPSLTQIIPAYNEVVIPSVEFLKTGSDPEDAKNGSADDQPGLGDLTVPPQGDGVNTNLAFMISQFPDEWVFSHQEVEGRRCVGERRAAGLVHGLFEGPIERGLRGGDPLVGCFADAECGEDGDRCLAVRAGFGILAEDQGVLRTVPRKTRGGGPC